MERTDGAWRGELRSASIVALVGMVAESATPEAVVKVLSWMPEVLR